MKIYDMNRPALPFSGMEMIPAMQGSSDVGIPLFAARELPVGDVIVMRRKYLADRGSTADSDPGTGNLRWNNVTPDSADTLFISDEDTETNNDMGTVLQDSVAPGGRIYIQASADTEARDNWQVWEIDDSGVANTGYTGIAVVLVDSNGVIADGDPIEVSVVNPSPEVEGVADRNYISEQVSTANNIDISYGYLRDHFIVSLHEDLDTITFLDFPPSGDNGRPVKYRFLFTQGSSPWAITWPAEFNWCGQTPPVMPTSPGAQMWVEIITYDAGASWDATFGIRD